MTSKTEEAVRLVQQGLTQQMAADKLGINQSAVSRAVSAHRRRLLEEYGRRPAADAACAVASVAAVADGAVADAGPECRCLSEMSVGELERETAVMTEAARRLEAAGDSKAASVCSQWGRDIARELTERRAAAMAALVRGE